MVVTTGISWGEVRDAAQQLSRRPRISSPERPIELRFRKPPTKKEGRSVYWVVWI